MKGFERKLVLKQRHKVTWKEPIEWPNRLASPLSRKRPNSTLRILLGVAIATNERHSTRVELGCMAKW